MPIYRYSGTPALSTFRVEKLLQRLQAAFSFVEHVNAHYVYFVDTLRELTAREQQQLCEILQAEAWDAFSFAPQDPEYHYSADIVGLSVVNNNDTAVAMATKTTLTLSQDAVVNDVLALVAPRIGTISPWSSKATDIIYNSGLTEVNRVERGIMYSIKTPVTLSSYDQQQLAELLYDRMTESVLFDQQLADSLFAQQLPAQALSINILDHGKAALINANQESGLALDTAEIDYLYQRFHALKRNPTDVELMMFAQINSEHCRHKIFNAHWIIDDKPNDVSLFNMIRNTHAQHPRGVLSAYQDNGAVLAGARVSRFWADPITHDYGYRVEEAPIVIKVETHNHPTAISPFAGAATGAGGEIRDEGAVGRGAIPKAGLTGFSVSNLRIPGFTHAWEANYGKPENIASALDIMLEAPIGAASFNNEFGRPGICGYFRTYEVPMRNAHGAMRGYHKPIMIAGGLGNIRKQHVEKRELTLGTHLIVLGGPAMLIGIGGGAASSMESGALAAALDFASVQRGNAEMQRRCQEVINTCWALGEDNPILSLHDVGAGGLSNALPELIASSQHGGEIELRMIPTAELGLSPLELWCNEAQERYVLGVSADNLATFHAIAERERCPFAVVGSITQQQQLRVTDHHFDNMPVDLPLAVLFGNTPKLVRTVVHDDSTPVAFDARAIDLMDAATRVLQLPCVADKSFLITIGDRSVTA